MPLWLIALHGPRILLEESKEGQGGGGGAPNPADALAKTIEELKAQNAALLARFEKLEGSRDKSEDDGDQDDLREKARKHREADDKKTSDSKALENALRFSLGAESWLKTNQGLLPKDVNDIFKAADKERYENAVEKDAAIKAGIVQSFFSIQNNMDLLTPGVKSQLEEYLKLTKTGKQEKAHQVYETIFEPALEMLRRVKKAEALSKGYGSSSDSDDSYKQKMITLSRKHYLGETEKHGT
jgi:hypothetical protein